MKKIYLLLLFVLLAVAIQAQNVASDYADAAAYNDGWTGGDNGGTGFNAWSFNNTGTSGEFIASSSAQGFGDINVNGESFGMWGNPSGANYSNASRTFNYTVGENTYTELQNGHTFSIYLATAYRNGNKGIDLKVGGTTVWNFNVGGDAYKVNDVDQGWAYSQSSIFLVEVTQFFDTLAYIKVSRGSDIYTNAKYDLNGRLSGFNLYCGGTDAGNDLNNLFSNSITIRTDNPVPVELTSFAAQAKAGFVQLNWATATEVNNYGFDVQRSAGNGWEKIAFIEGNGNSNSPKSYSFTDKNVLRGTYSYRLKQIDTDGQFEYSDVVAVEINNLPSVYSLDQNYPNPFNPTTNIKFGLPKDAFVSLKVFNILGQEVKTLLAGFKPAGEYVIPFDASDLTSGLYLYKLETEGFSSVRKMLLTK